MTSVETGFAIAYLLALIPATPRGRIWLMAALGSFLVSSIYWRIGGPMAAGVALALDAAICYAIYFTWRRLWEVAVYLALLFMATINLAQLLGSWGVVSPISHLGYAVALEAANVAIILTIVGSGILKRMGARYGVDSPNWLRRSLAYVGLVMAKNRKRPAFIYYEK